MSVIVEQVTRHYLHEQKASKELVRVFELFNCISGKETTDELNKIAQHINYFYKNRQVKDFIDPSLELASRLPFPMSQLTIIEAIDRLRSGDDMYDGFRLNNKHLLHALTSASLYNPLVQQITHAIESATDPEQLAAMIYTAYEIENIFVHPLREAVLLVKMLEHESISTENQPTDPEILSRVTQAISEFYLTAKNLKTAWAYFGSENAQVFLELLESGPLSQRIYQDLLQLARKGKILYPAQLYSILLQITPAGEHFAVSHLIAFYTANEANSLTSLTSALNFSITGDNRAFEYSDAQLERAVHPNHRQSDILSFGGSVSRIEILRSRKLASMQPKKNRETASRRIITVDRQRRFQAVRNTLAIRDELSQPIRSQDTLVSKSQIAQDQVTANLVHIAHELPLTTAQLTELLRKHGINPNTIHIVFDQRASLLYLSGDARRVAIETAVKLLSKNGGGTYFATRGLASHLFVDIVLSIKRFKKDIAATVVLADTTDDGVVQTSLKAAMLEPKHSEFSSRRIGGKIASKQPSRRADRLHQLQLATTVKSLADQIAWSTKHGRLIFNPLDGMEFTGEIAHAVALDIGLPMLVSSQLSTAERQVYQTLLRQLAIFLRMLENGLDVTRFQFTCEVAPSYSFVTFLECLKQLPKFAGNEAYREKLLTTHSFVKNQLTHKPLISWVISAMYPDVDVIEPRIGTEETLLEQVAVGRALIQNFESQVQNVLFAGPDTVMLRILYSAIIDALFRFHQQKSIAWYFSGPSFNVERHEDLVEQTLSLLLLPKDIDRENLPYNYKQMLFFKPDLDAIYSNKYKWNLLLESAQRFFKTRNNQT